MTSITVSPLDTTTRRELLWDKLSTTKEHWHSLRAERHEENQLWDVVCVTHPQAGSLPSLAEGEDQELWNIIQDEAEERSAACTRRSIQALLQRPVNQQILWGILPHMESDTEDSCSLGLALFEYGLTHGNLPDAVRYAAYLASASTWEARMYREKGIITEEEAHFIQDIAWKDSWVSNADTAILAARAQALPPEQKEIFLALLQDAPTSSEGESRRPVQVCLEVAQLA